jgi:hypothetical protein
MPGVTIIGLDGIPFLRFEGNRVQVTIDALLDLAAAYIAAGLPSGKWLATGRRAFSGVTATP